MQPEDAVTINAKFGHYALGIAQLFGLNMRVDLCSKAGVAVPQELLCMNGADAEKKWGLSRHIVRKRLVVGMRLELPVLA